jgi:hypothetical protein
MQRFIIEHNIENFVRCLREVESSSERSTLRRLLEAEIDRYIGAEQAEPIEIWIRKVEREIAAAGGLGHGSKPLHVVPNLRYVLQLSKERQKRLSDSKLSVDANGLPETK